MKILFTLAFAVLFFPSLGQKIEKNNDYKQIETILTDLNADKILDSILLSSNLPDNTLFNRITISITGHNKQSFQAIEEWTEVDKSYLADNENSVKSNNLFLYTAKDHSIILLFGILDGAGYRGDFSIIYIKVNKPIMVFNKTEKDVDVEIPISLTDLNNDGRTEFIFRNFGELYQQVDSLNADIGTYHPYLVYTIDTDCKLNEQLTRKYNNDNYVFAGYEYSEQIKILYPRDGSKPKLWNYKK